jgi:uncharacterized protein (TIGR02001 family)
MPKFAALAAAVGSLALAGAARAQDATPSFSFNIGANTDYVFRGFSQSDEDPSVFGGIDATLGLAYAGAWASKVDFGNGTDAELDLYAGVKPTAGPVSFDIGIIYYGYIDSCCHQAYWEGKVAASVPAGPATLGAAVYYSPEFFGKTGDALYYEANASVAVPGTPLSISGALGRQEIDKAQDYTTWNIGVGFALNDHVGFDVRYWDTDLSKAESGGLGDSRIVGGIKLAW